MTSVLTQPDLHFEVWTLDAANGSHHEPSYSLVADRPCRPAASALGAVHSEDSAELERRIAAEAAIRAEVDAALTANTDLLRADATAESQTRATADGALDERIGVIELLAEVFSNHVAEDKDLDPTNELQEWSTLPGIPADFVDGVDNVYDADNAPTNELQSWATLPGIPAGFADGTSDVIEFTVTSDNERGAI